MFSNWKKQNPPEKKKSFLWKFKDEIFAMRREEYTFKQIRDALISEYKIATTVQNISYFYNKLQKENYQPSTTNNNPTTQSQKDTKTISNQNTTTNEKPKEKKKIVQLKQKKDPKKHYMPPPKTISDEEFLTLCNKDKITYCYKLFIAGYEEEGDRLMKLPDVYSVTRSQYRHRKRGSYERLYFKERQDLDLEL